MADYLYLCRHGQSQWNAQGLLQGQCESSLSQLGQQQAQMLANTAKDWAITKIYHSTLSRAQQTAEICADQLAIESIQLKGIQERHYGHWQGQAINTLTDMENFKGSCYTDKSTLPCPLGESTEHVQTRMLAALQHIANTAPAGNLMLVSHGDAIDCLLCLWDKPQYLGNGQYVRLIKHNKQYVLDKTFV